jgi:hypothetical protein
MVVMEVVAKVVQVLGHMVEMQALVVVLVEVVEVDILPVI